MINNYSILYQTLTLFVVIFFINQNVITEQKKNEDTAQQNNLIIIIKEIQALYKLLKAKSAFSIIKEKIY